MFLDFDVDLDKAKSNLEIILQKSRADIEKLISIENKTYNNFVKVFQDISYKIDIFFTPIAHIDSVLNSEKSSKVYEELLPLLSQYSNEISQSRPLLDSFKHIRSSSKNLTDSQIKLLDDEIKNFELNGVGLNQKDKNRCKEISLKLKQLSKQFSQNVLEEIKDYSLVVENFNDVKNIPQSDLDNAKFKVGDKTKYKFTLQTPSYLSYITYGSNPLLREELYKRYVTLGKNNEKIIDDILLLKEEISKLLGFDNYADLSLESKSAESKEIVLDFLDKLSNKAKDRAKQEILNLEEFFECKIESFDFAYYKEKYQQEKLKLDSTQYRPYFEKNRVVDGLMNFLEDLFNISIKKVKSKKTWHKDVVVYEFNINNHTSRVYLDLEARENKRNGAWMNNWQTYHIDNKNNIEMASAFVVCNFPASNNSVSLLRHDDVVTLFHEMGHTIHHLFSQCEDEFISGVNGVCWDVIEFPSQFLEKFAFNKEVLQKFAIHYKDGNVLPTDMIDKLIETKNFMSAYDTMRQLEFAIFDVKIHSKLYQKEEVQHLLDEIRCKISPLIPPSYNKFQNNFSHIFAGGYASGYYSYKWAEVMSADLYLEVVKNGHIDKDLIKKYFDFVLKKGGSMDMNIIFKNILDRDPNIDSLLHLSGIV